MRRTRIGRGAVAAVAAVWLLLTGAVACNDSGPGVPPSGEQGDPDGNGDNGGTDDGDGEPGEGGAGDEGQGGG